MKFDYCYVRYEPYLRVISRKFFFTPDTTLAAFIRAAQSHGIVRRVDFPTTPEPISAEEVATAQADGRVVL